MCLIRALSKLSPGPPLYPDELFQTNAQGRRGFRTLDIALVSVKITLDDSENWTEESDLTASSSWDKI